MNELTTQQLYQAATILYKRLEEFCKLDPDLPEFFEIESINEDFIEIAWNVSSCSCCSPEREYHYISWEQLDTPAEDLIREAEQRRIREEEEKAKTIAEAARLTEELEKRRLLVLAEKYPDLVQITPK